MAPSALPTADSDKWFIETAAARAPSWRNEVTLRTIEYAFGYEPGAYIGLISPTPLLLIVAAKDHLAVSDLAIAAYERAFEPKRWSFCREGTSRHTWRRSINRPDQPVIGFVSTLDKAVIQPTLADPPALWSVDSDNFRC